MPQLPLHTSTHFMCRSKAFLLYRSKLHSQSWTNASFLPPLNDCHYHFHPAYTMYTQQAEFCGISISFRAHENIAPARNHLSVNNYRFMEAIHFLPWSCLGSTTEMTAIPSKNISTSKVNQRAPKTGLQFCFHSAFGTWKSRSINKCTYACGVLMIGKLHCMNQITG